MKIDISELNEEQLEEIEKRLEAFDNQYITYKLNGNIRIGAFAGSELAGGVDACMTAFHILYVSTVYVEEKFRRQGIGRMLMAETEKRARELGANMIRLDTFDWQGKDFYLALGYEQVGSYRNEEDGFEEYFFLKKI